MKNWKTWHMIALVVLAIYLVGVAAAFVADDANRVAGDWYYVGVAAFAAMVVAFGLRNRQTTH